MFPGRVVDPGFTPSVDATMRIASHQKRGDARVDTSENRLPKISIQNKNLGVDSFLS
jgi:hypothetical protein